MSANEWTKEDDDNSIIPEAPRFDCEQDRLDLQLLDLNLKEPLSKVESPILKPKATTGQDLVSHANVVAKKKEPHGSLPITKDVKLVAVRNKVSKDKILNQINSNNQNQLIRDNGCGIAEGARLHVHYNFRGLPFEAEASPTTMYSELKIEVAFINLLNPMISGNLIFDMVKYYILYNGSQGQQHITPNNISILRGFVVL
jgi:hypothetical protein